MREKTEKKTSNNNMKDSIVANVDQQQQQQQHDGSIISELSHQEEYEFKKSTRDYVVGDIRQQQTTAVSSCSSWLRYIRRIPKVWPRTFYFIVGVIIPLWALVLIATGFGVLLAQYESEPEIESNNAIIASSYKALFLNNNDNNSSTTNINNNNGQQPFLLELPILCFEEYQQDPTTKTIEQYILDVVNNNNNNNTTTTTNNNNNSTISNYTVEDAIMDYETELYSYLQNCSDRFQPIVEDARLKQFESSLEGTSGLTFNWVRCLDDDKRSGFVYSPSDELIIASRPENQAVTFLKAWKNDQEMLYNSYLIDIDIDNNNNDNNNITTDDDAATSREAMALKNQFLMPLEVVSVKLTLKVRHGFSLQL